MITAALLPALLTMPTDSLLAAMRTREPDQIIRNIDDSPYLLRWFVTPRSRQFNVYLHRFLSDDDDRALHDHPWHSLSLILDGGYRDILPGDIEVLRNPGDIVYRSPEDAHRVCLHRDQRGATIPATTLFITGAKVRDWGFHCPQGWVHQRDFTVPGDGGRIGKGCAQ